MSMSKHHGKKTASTDDPTARRLAYLHKIGLNDMTAEDLEAPDLDDFGTRTSDDFELTGKDVHGDFEYYRSTNDLSLRKAEEIGYFRLPKGTDAKFKGCHTEDEVMMARLKTTGAAYRKAEHTRREALRSGTTTGQTPMGGAVFNETTERSTLPVHIQER